MNKNKMNYITRYKKENYKRKEALLRQEDAEKLEAILKSTGETFTIYAKRHIQADFEKLNKGD